MAESQRRDSKFLYSSIAASLYISLTAHKGLASNERLVVRGSTIVTQLMKITRFNRPEAVSFCEDLVRDGIISHVDHFEPFQDSPSRFRFNHACAEDVVTCVMELAEMNEINYPDLPTELLHGDVNQEGARRENDQDYFLAGLSAPELATSAQTEDEITAVLGAVSSTAGTVNARAPEPDPVFDRIDISFYRTESEGSKMSEVKNVRSLRTFWRSARRRKESNQEKSGIFTGMRRVLKGIFRRKKQGSDAKSDEAVCGDLVDVPFEEYDM